MCTYLFNVIIVIWTIAIISLRAKTAFKFCDLKKKAFGLLILSDA